MHKSTRYTFTLLILTQAFAVALLPILKVAAEPHKGVEVSDHFNYGKFNIWISDPSVLMTTTLFDTWKKFQNLKEINFKIIPPTTNPDLIYFNQTITFTSNDTVKELSGAVDIDSGDSEGAQGTLFFTAAGLEKEARIYPGSQNFTFTVNETRTDPIHWPGREICVFNITTIESKDNMRLLTRTIIYWDKLTGVLLALGETKGGSVGQTLVVEGTVSYRLVATNRFVVPQSEEGGFGDITLYIAIIVVLIAALIVIVVRLSTSAPKKKWKRLKE
jgi:hypothetical protein